MLDEGPAPVNRPLVPPYGVLPRNTAGQPAMAPSEAQLQRI